MNYYFIAAGLIGTLGGFAHTFLGHKWTINAIDVNSLRSTQNSQDQDRRFLIWFWHVGSVVLISTSGLIALQGFSLVDLSLDLIQYLSFLWLSITIVFIVIASETPVQYFKMIPGLVGVPVNTFILLGIYL